jgi:hypothetical protein
VWVGFHEDFEDRPSEVLENIFRFLGVNPEFSPVEHRRDLEAQVPRLPAIGWLKRSGFWQAAASVTPPGLRPLIRRAVIRKPGTTPMDPVDREFLIDYYREDIQTLAGLVSRNLDGWLRQT